MHVRLPLFVSVGTVGPRLSFLQSHVQLPVHRRSTICSLPRKSRTPQPAASLETPVSLLKRIESDPVLRVIDIRGRVAKPGGRVEEGFQPFEYIADDEAYDTSHIPSATFLDWRTIDLAKPDALIDILSTHGITKETRVVVYDWGNMCFATRAWFAFKAMGVPEVAVLNGGWHAWEEGKHPVDDHSPCPLTVYAQMESHLAEGEIPEQTLSLKEMRSLVDGDRSFALVDARSEEEFKGITRRFRRAGHIPGATNLPYRSLLNEDGFGLRSEDEIRQILERAGLLNRDVVTYCSGGVSSTVVLFSLVMSGVSFGKLRNYCGSFGEWGNLDDTPIETG